MVTSKDVAALAGVSQATVSYVMSGSRPISEKTKKRVREAMRQLGYYPNASARALAGHRAGVIGAVVHMNEYTQFDELLPFISTMTHEVRKRGSNLMLIPAEEGMDAVRQLVGESIVDALAVFDITRDDPRLLELGELNVPTVLIGMPDDDHGLHCVEVNYSRIAWMAMERLAETGVRKAVLVGDVDDRSHDYWFVQTFENEGHAAAEELGMEFEMYWPSASGRAGLSGIAGKLAEWADDSVGLAVRTPLVVEWIMQEMLIAGIRPGRDIPLVGVCSDGFAKNRIVPLTNVSPVAEELSVKAVERLFDLLDGKDPEDHRQWVEPVSTVRDTTIPVK